MRIFFAFISLVFGRFNTGILYDRLLKGWSYVLDTNQTGCTMDYHEAVEAFEKHPWDSELVPDECVKYIRDESEAANPSRIPTAFTDSPMPMEMDVTLEQFHGINAREQRVYFTAIMDFTWRDDFLHWRPSLNNGIKHVIITPDKIWTPDVALIDNLSDDFDKKYQAGVTVAYDGTCHWVTIVNFEAGCVFDMTFFPYDTQACPLTFGPWTYSSRDISFRIKTPTNNVTGPGQTGQMLVSPMKPNSTEWNILSTNGIMRELKYPCCEDEFPEIIYEIVFERYTLLPTLSIVVPCILTVILIILGFFLPPDAGEKIGLNITIMLALVVFMDQLTQQIPPMPSKTPLIGQFFVASLVLVVCSLISTVFCLRLHHTSGEEAKRMPKWIRCVFIDSLPKILFTLGPPPDRPQEKSHEEETAKAEEINKFVNEVKTPTERLLMEILKELACINKASMDGDLGAAYEEEWKYAATVFDRVMAYFYILALIVLLLSTVLTRFWRDTSPVTTV